MIQEKLFETAFEENLAFVFFHEGAQYVASVWV